MGRSVFPLLAAEAVARGGGEIGEGVGVAVLVTRNSGRERFTPFALEFEAMDVEI